MIDLHIHTLHSDGDCTVLEILRKCQKEKLDIISITDHNQISAYDELDKIKIEEHYKGKIVVGTELKCVYNHMPMEILAYGFSLSEMQKSKYIMTPQKLYDVQSSYLESIKENGEKIGLYFDKSIVLGKQNLEFASAIFEREILRDKRNIEILKQNGIEMKQSFYREAQSNPNSIFYIDETKDYPKMQEVIDEIHNMNGLAFLAHLYESPLQNHEKTMKDIIKKHNLDGVECYHSGFRKEEMEWMVNFCKTNKLYMSGGSDYHGKAKPTVKLGKAVCGEHIPNQIVNDWIDNIEYF